MAFKDSLKTGMDLVGNTINDVATVINEKNKLRAQCVRIKDIIKHDAESRDRAYIELGRYYYQNLRDKEYEQTEKYCQTVDRMNDRIEKASFKYMELQDMQNNLKIQSENAEKLKAAMTAKAQQIKESGIEKTKELNEKAKNYAAQKMVSDADDAITVTDIPSGDIDTADIENAVNMVNGELASETLTVEENKTVVKETQTPQDIPEKPEEELSSEIITDPAKKSDIPENIKEIIDRLPDNPDMTDKPQQTDDHPENPASYEEESPDSFDFKD